MKRSGIYFKLADPKGQFEMPNRYEDYGEAEADIPVIHARQIERGYKPDPLIIIKVEWEHTTDDFGTFVSSNTKEYRV